MAIGRSQPVSLKEHAPGGQIVLKPPSWADFEAWHQIRQQSRDFLTQWEPAWHVSHLTRPAYKNRLAAYTRMINNGTGYPFHIFRLTEGDLIGACHLSHVQRGAAQSAQIGYWLGEAYAKKGFARAAVRALVRHSFDTLGLHRLEAAVQPDNDNSIRLLKALGFQKEGTARAYLKINDAWRDHDIYSLLSSD